MNYRTYWGEIKTLPGVVRNFVFSDRSGLIYTKIAYGQHPKQYMLFCPANEESPQQNEFIYFIHGGGWRFGKPERYIPAARLFCQLGYDVILVTHRRAPRYKFPHLHEDIFQSFQTAVQLELLKEKTAIVIGISAGGNLGGLLVYDRKSLRKIGLNQSRFSGFVSIAGALNLSAFPDTFPLRSYAGKWGSKQFYKASPITYLQAPENLPALCMHGTQDAVVPYESSTSFVQKLRDCQCSNVTLYTVKDGKHFPTTLDWFLTRNAETEIILEWIEKSSLKK